MKITPINMARQSVIDSVEALLVKKLGDWENVWFGMSGFTGRLYSPRSVKDSIDGPVPMGDALISNGNWYALTASKIYIKTGDHFAANLCSELMQQKISVYEDTQAISQSTTPEAARVQTALATRCITDFIARIKGEEPRPETAWVPMAEIDGELQPQGIWAVFYVYSETFSFLVVFDAATLGDDFLGLPDQAAEALRPIALQNLNHRVDVAASLGRLPLTIQQLKKLKLGDVIQLDRRLDENIEMRAGNGMRLCKGSLGTSGGVKALRMR